MSWNELNLVNNNTDSSISIPCKTGENAHDTVLILNLCKVTICIELAQVVLYNGQGSANVHVTIYSLQIHFPGSCYNY